MKNRGIAAGLCIGLVLSLNGCGKNTPGASDFVVSRTQEEAREEVRRHIEPETDGKRTEEERRREQSEEAPDRKQSEEEQSRRQSGEQSEKKSETARAAAEEELRRKSEELERRENDGSSSRRREEEDSAARQRKSDGTFQVDCISFALPDGWDKDDYMSDDYDTVFAPDGDMDTAMDCLIVSQTSEAFGMVDMFLENMDEMVSMLEEEMAEEEEEYRVTIDDIGMTFLGHTLKMEAFVRDEEGAGFIVLYFAEDDTNMYSLYAYSLFDEDEEVDEDAGLSVQMEEALHMFFETGRVENREL